MDTGSWIVVSVAVLLVSAVLGVHLNRPAWSGGSARRLAPILFSLQCGLAALAGIVGVTAAFRSWQVLHEAQTGTAPLIDVSRIDGDGDMYALLVLAMVAGTVIAVLVLGLAARFASGTDPVELIVACSVLAIEIFLGSLGLWQVLQGSRGVVALGLLVQLPLAIAAMVSCWPPPEPLHLSGTDR